MILATTNKLQLYMLDGTHVIDYVQFSGPNSVRNVNSMFQTTNTTPGYGNMWSTAPFATGVFKGVPYGIANQIDMSESSIPAGAQSYWQNLTTAEEQIDGFATLMGKVAPYGLASIKNSQLAQSYQTTSMAQVPYSPSVTVVDYTSWEANDPLVHYVTNDLYFQDTGTRSGIQSGVTINPNVLPGSLPDIGQLSQRFAPWSVIGSATAINPNVDHNASNPAYKDPGLIGPDHWDFPTNKYPTVGWVGRVHRGTPWQTVYLKASNELTQTKTNNDGTVVNVGVPTWAFWTGNQNAFDVNNTGPAQDRLLFDLFTTALDDNGTRGQLSVNQSHLAAWSALFSGMVVPTNWFGNYAVIQPAGANYTNFIPRASTASDYFVPTNPLAALWAGIQQTRQSYVNADGLTGSFEHKGDILSVPQLHGTVTIPRSV